MLSDIPSSDLVSVGVPAYNRPEHLSKVLTCITNQTYQNLEIIISDDYSTDERVRKVIQEFAEKDSRVKAYRQNENIGLLKNFQFVLEKSTGVYFAWFSDDDWRSPEFVEVLVNILKNKKSVNWAFCEFHEIYEDGKFAVGYPFSHLRYLKPFVSKYKVIRMLSHFWQNQKNGKCNLFYSLFRKEFLSTINFKEVSHSYTYIGVDNQISYKLLQVSPIAISKNAMCCITCQNIKYYNLNPISKKSPKLYFYLFNFLKSFLFESYVYIKNTNGIEFKLLIFLLLLPKLLKEFLESILVYIKKSINQQFKTNQKSFYARESEKQKIVTTAKLNLSNVTLVSVDTRDAESALKALIYSSQEIEFGKIKLLSNYTPFCSNNKIIFHRIPELKGINDWCYFIVYELYKYIDTDYILLIHADGFIVNPSEWRTQFLNYDYIGAPWPIPADNYSYRDIRGNLIRVGNSVSIRSKKLLELPSKLNIPWIPDHGFFNEDGFICCKNRHILEAQGIRYAPLEIAKYFAHESMIPEIKNIKPFAFHKWMGTNSKYPNFKKNQFI